MSGLSNISSHRIVIYNSKELEAQSKIDKPASPTAFHARVSSAATAIHTTPILSTHDLRNVKKLAGNVLGDKFLKGTGLEGESAIEVMKLTRITLVQIQGFLKASGQDHSSVDKLLQSLNLGLLFQGNFSTVGSSQSGIEATTADIRDAIQNLKEGEGIILCGGWCGNPTGHAIYYEITRNSLDSFTFTAFNTGAGANKNHDHAILSSGGAAERAPVITKLINPRFTISNISLANICNPLFWIAAMEMKTFISDKPYNPSDFYTNLLPWLKGTIVHDVDVEHMVVPQHSGTCTVQGILALAKARLSKAHFHYFDYSIKFNQLNQLNLVFHSIESLRDDHEGSALLEKSCAQFAIETAAAFTTGNLPLFLIQESNKLLKSIQERLATAKTARIAICTLVGRHVSFNMTHSVIHGSVERTPVFTLNQPVTALTAPPPPMRLNKAWIPTQNTVAQRLLEESVAYNPDEELYPEIVVENIRTIFTILPFPNGKKDDFWFGLSEEHLQMCMQSIHSLTYSLISICQKMKIAQNLERKLDILCALYSARIIQQTLAKQLNELQPLGVQNWNLIPYELDEALLIPANPSGDNEVYDSATKLRFAKIHQYCAQQYRRTGRFFQFTHYWSKQSQQVEFNLHDLDNERNILYKYLTEKGKVPTNVHPSIVLNEAEASSFNLIPPTFYLLREQILMCELFLRDITFTGEPRLFMPTRNENTVAVRNYDFPEQAAAFRFDLISKKWVYPVITPSPSLFDVCYHENASIYDADAMSQIPSESVSLALAIRGVWAKEVFLGAPASARIIKALDYFTAHIDLLKRPEMQLFLRKVLMHNNDLASLFINYPDCQIKFNNFLDAGYSHFQKERNIPGMMSMAYLYHLTQESLLITGNISQVQSIEKRLNATLAICTTTEEKFLVRMQLAYNFTLLPEKEKYAKATEIIATGIFLKNHSRDNFFTNSHIKLVYEKFLTDLHPLLQTVLSDEKLIIHLTVATSKIMEMDLTKGASPADLNWSYHPPLLKASLKDEDLFCINTSTFALTLSNRKLGYLPPSIINNRLFQQYFSSLKDKLVEIQRFDVYSFDDAEGRHVLIKEENNVMKLQRQFDVDGPFFEHIASDADELEEIFDESIKHTIILKKYDCWMSVGRHQTMAIFCKPGTDECVYRVILLDTNIKTKQRFVILNHQNLALAPLEHPAYNFLSALEDQDNILIWLNAEKKIAEVELPRLNLSFQMKDNKLVCKQITDHYISENQMIPFLEPFKDYMVLQNTKGEKRIIIPNKSYKNMGTSLNPSFELDKSTEQSQHYFEYRLNERNELISIHPSGGLFLGYVLLGLHRYKEAQNYFRTQSFVLKKYKTAELITFQQILYMADIISMNDPKIAAVCLSACSLLIKNQQIHGAKFSKIDDILLSYYDFYLTNRQLMGDILLTTSEEISILKEISLNSRFHKKRLDFLLKKVEPLENFQFVKEGIVDEVTQKESFDARSFMTALISPPLPKFASLMTRTVYSKEFFHDLQSTYKTLKATPTDEKWSKALELEGKYMFTHSEYLPFLIAVTLAPQEFSAIDKILHSIDDMSDNIYAALEPFASELEAMNKTAEAIYRGFSQKARPKLIESSSDKKVTTSKTPYIPIPSSAIKESAAAPSTIVWSPDAVSKQIAVDLFNISGDSKEVHEPVVQQLEQIKKELVKAQGLLEQLSKSDNSVSKDNLQQKIVSLKKLKENLEAFLKEPPPISLVLKPQKDLLASFEVSFKALSKESATIRQNKENREKQIIALANKINIGNPATLVLHQAKLISKDRKEITIEDLCVCFLKNNIQTLTTNNPFLSGADIATLRQQVTDYLIETTQIQRLDRQQSALKDVLGFLLSNPEKENVAIDPVFTEFTNKAWNTLQETRHYDPTKNYSVLVFEAFTNLSLRKEQVTQLEQLSSTPNMIVQMIMGSGKSKVLLPILALAKANGDNLPIVIIPAPLLDVVIHDMQKTMGTAFQNSVHTLRFDRSTEFTVDKLTNILDYLNEIRTKRECVMMTNKSAACLLLKYEEALSLYAKTPSEELYKKIELLQQILKLLKTKGQAIIDEADFILNSRSEINFTKAASKITDRNDQALIADERRNLISTIYSVLMQPEFCKEIGGNLINSYATLSKEYPSKIKPILMQKVLSSELFKKELQFFSARNLATIKAYLLGDTSPDVEAYIKTLGYEELKIRLPLLKAELNQLLPMTLDKTYCVDYGLSLRKKDLAHHPAELAIPYSGNHAPVESSEFSSPDILINYTLQTVCINGLSSQQVYYHVKELIRKAKSEVDKLSTAVSLQQTAAYKIFQQYTDGIDVPFNDKFSMDDAHMIAEHLNKLRNHQPKQFMDFVNSHILTQVKFHDEQFSCNAIDFIDIFQSAIGFTGTPWNSETYAEALRTHTQHAKAAEGKTTALIHQNASAAGGMRVLSDGRFPASLNDIIRPQDDAVIDTGAVFNNVSNERIARAILDLLTARKSTKTAVIFFHKNSIKIMVKDGKEYKIRPFIAEEYQAGKQFFTYYDQIHSTGTDIPQMPFANATMTVGKDVTKRDLFQGVWRLRGLDKKQKIAFAITKEALSKMQALASNTPQQTLSSLDLLNFINFNEQTQLKTHLLFATRQKIKAVIKRIVILTSFKAQLEISLWKDGLKNLIADIEPILISINNFNPGDIYGPADKLIETSKLITSLKKHAYDQLAKIHKDSLIFFLYGSKDDCLKHLQDELANALGDTEKLLPEHVSSQLSNLESLNETERMQETEVQAQQSVQKEVAMEIQNKSDPGLFIDYPRKSWQTNKGPPDIFSEELHRTSSSLTAVQTHSLVDVFNRNHFLSPFKAIFKGVSITENVVPSPMSNPNIFKYQQIPAQYVLEVYNKRTGSLHLELIDVHSDFVFYLNSLRKDKLGNYPVKQREVELRLSSFQQDLIVSSKEWVAHNKEIAEQRAILFVKAKIFRCEIFFSENEKGYIQSLVKEHSGKLIYNFYVTALKDNPSKLELFRKSNLALWLT